MGTAYGSSRNSNVKLSIYNKVKLLFAEFIKVQATVTYSSGTLAGKLVLEYLTKSENSFYHYPKSHTAILHSKSLPVFVNDNLHPNLLNNIVENIVITADASLGLEGGANKGRLVKRHFSKKRITLVVDESHSLGITGKHIEGLMLNTGFKFNKNYPVIYCVNENICDYLFENEIIITNFKYPTYKTVMSRIVLTSNHSKDDLGKLKR